MQILFVDDQPAFKVYKAIHYLQNENFNFDYKIVNSVNSALEYIDTYLNDIDLAVVDLGLPMYDNGLKFDNLNGLKVVDKILKRNLNIPIIINSTTPIPNKESFIQSYIEQSAHIEHVKLLDGKWLMDFIKTM